MKKKLKTFTSKAISDLVAHIEMLLSNLVRVWFLVGLLLLAIPSFAADITFAQAEKVAKNFLWEHSVESDYQSVQPHLVYTNLHDGINLYYVFGFQNHPGFVIVPSDDLLVPILGYSLENSFDAEHWSANFTYWMEQYTVSIIDAKGAPNQKTIAKVRKQWDKYIRSIPEKMIVESSVSPLLSSQWSQGKYYNAYCPEDINSNSDGHAVVGCVATAIGQIMKYHNHPVQGTGAKSYYSPIYGLIEANFGNTTYNWYNMPDKLYDYNDDVAELLFHVGVATRMRYGPHGSGTFSSQAENALKKHFGYSPDLDLVYRKNIIDQDWINMIVAELDAQRPIYYAGFHGNSGHAFVCDGYDDNNLFHFNWGWGSNGGYYSIDAPLYYTERHQVIIGIVPVDSDCPGNITFSSQEQIDNFATSYPGCTEITGSVRIAESVVGNITNLDGLSQIQSIGLGLWISGNQALVNLSGLEYITSIGDILWIDNNPSLASLSGLDGLVSVSGDFSLFANPALINFTGLGNLQEFGGNFLVANNLSLVGLNGADNLTSIGGYLFVSDNPVLQDLIGLEQVTSIMGTISVIGNASLTTLNGIQHIDPLTVQSPLKIFMNPNLSICAVQVICDYLGLSGNATVIHDNALGCNNSSEIEAACTQNCPDDFTFTSQQQIDDFSTDFPNCAHILGKLAIQEAVIGDITNLAGLSQIQSVGGELRVEHNTALVNLNGLENISAVGSLLIGVNPALTSISQLSGITELDNLTMAWNSHLLDFTGLHNITRVYADVQFHYTSVENLLGLNSLSTIGSFLIITGNANLPNLDGLQNLSSIGERLFIVNNASLVSLNGLDNLASVTGNFTVRVNASLSSLSGLGSLTNIGGSFYVGGNPLLTNLIGLSSLSSVGDYFRVDDAALVNFVGLESLLDIGGDVSVFNTDIVNFNGLESVAAIGGNLYVDSNSSLVSLNGIQNIDPTSIQYVTIANNAILSECSVLSICDYFGLSGVFADVHSNALGCNTIDEIEDACAQNCPINIKLTSQQQIDDFAINYPNCTSINGYLEVTETIEGNILNLDGLSQIESISDFLYIHSNETLGNLDGLSSLNYIGNALVIGDNNTLVNLQGLMNLNSILGPILVNGNEQLSTLQGLEGITAINDYLEVMGNPNLLNVSGLNNVVSISGGVNIGNNDALGNIDGLHALMSVGGNLIIQNCASLTSLTGLEQLTSIGSYLVVFENDLLVNLDGLSGLQSIGDFLHISGNNLLESISGIQYIDPGSIHSNSTNHEDLEIYNNPSLSNCSIQSVCDFLGINGVTTDIHDNKIGCNSPLEVEMACASGGECAPIVGFTSLGVFNGHTYYLSNFEKNWRQAQLIAIQEDCHIASITSQVENDFIQSFLGNSIVLIGLNDDNIEGQLVWDSGEPVTLDLSYGNTIDNDFAVMNFWDGSWEMVNQWVAKRFVLEKDCSTSEGSMISSRDNQFQNRSIVLWDVYPNPADDIVVLRISNDTEKETICKVYDARGQLHLEKTMNLPQGPSELEMDISPLPNGLYFVQFEGEANYMNFVKIK